MNGVVPALEEALVESLGGSVISIVNRRRDPSRVSTFPAEIVTVDVDGERLNVFCKYQGNSGHNSYGHRSGVAYEAEVYRRVLSRLKSTTVRYHGHRSDAESGETWLFLDYLHGSRPCFDQPTTGRFRAVARWLGAFHREIDGIEWRDDLDFLSHYDRSYYSGWIERTIEFSQAFRKPHPWVFRVCKRFDELLDELLESPVSVIHGEVYRKNVLCQKGLTYPVDWESAAVAPGVIDLACVCDGAWTEEVKAQGQSEYVQARWPEGAPESFERMLSLARVYTRLRWLGERPDWTMAAAGRGFSGLRSAATDAGLLGPEK